MKKILLGLVIAMALAISLPGQAFAGPKAVGAITLYSGAYLRIYNNPTDARAGHDGWCYKGQDNPKDWACTIDQTRGKEYLYSVPNGTNGSLFGGTTRMFAQPRFNGQAPYCLPDRLVGGGSGRNEYYCGYQG